MTDVGKEKLAERMPPLDWIRVFDVAARTGSFAGAAGQLSRSPGAVSRTVKELESYLGVELFVRLARGVKLTETGIALAEAVRPAIERIAIASEQFSRRRETRILRVTVMPALGERWLVPRLGRFRNQHPDISVELSADAGIVDLQNAGFDLGLRYCTQPDGPLETIELFPDELFPVAAPELLDQYRVTRFEDIFKLPALQDTLWESDWDLWFGAAGISRQPNWRPTSFSLYSMALCAAISGQGALMAHRILVQDEIRAGRLTAIYDLKVRSEKAFFLVRDPHRVKSAAARAFINWVSAEATKERYTGA